MRKHWTCKTKKQKNKKKRKTDTILGIHLSTIRGQGPSLNKRDQDIKSKTS